MLESATLRTRMNTFSPLEGMGTALEKTKSELHAIFDFAVSGGAVGVDLIKLKDKEGNVALLPKGAYITQSFVIVETAVTAVGACNLSFGSVAADDILAPTAKASLGAGVKVDGKQTGLGATFVGPATVVLGTPITATISDTAILTGRVHLFLSYVIVP